MPEVPLRCNSFAPRRLADGMRSENRMASYPVAVSRVIFRPAFGARSIELPTCTIYRTRVQAEAMKSLKPGQAWPPAKCIVRPCPVTDQR